MKKVEDVRDDPAQAAGLATEAQELSSKGAELATAGLSQDEAQEVADCTERSTNALMPG
ncbi:MAG TPA: hypothetical protein VHK88_09085 [Aquihabitans sp.]|nr:hypothetical protein [Aquihabitans sp.]